MPGIKNLDKLVIMKFWKKYLMVLDVVEKIYLQNFMMTSLSFAHLSLHIMEILQASIR